jgi:hypothetical protein
MSVGIERERDYVDAKPDKLLYYKRCPYHVYVRTPFY